jgi:hypothetical protein
MTNAQMRKALFLTSMVCLTSTMLLLVWATFTSGNVPFFDNARMDQNYINDLMHGVKGTSQANGAFENTAQFYSVIQSSLMDARIFLVLLGVVNFWLVYRYVTRVSQIFLTLAWTMVAIILVLNAAGKDAITVCLMFACTVWLLGRPVNLFTFAVIAGLYSLYALLFREYYFLILALGIALFGALQIRGSTVRVLALTTMAILGMTAGGSAVSQLEQNRRDLYIELLEGRSWATGVRSQFDNPWPAESLAGRIENAVYATARLTFPVIWGRSVKDLLFTAYPLAVIYTLWLCFSVPSRKLKLIGCLITGSVLISILFEPDVGSFARHSSTMFPFLAVIFQDRNHRDLTSQLVFLGSTHVQ